jgi:hypothetical protein
VMPWNYSSREQVSGWRYLFYPRLWVAVGRRSVRFDHDLPKNNPAAQLALAVVAALIRGLCFMLAVFNPAGQVGGSRVLADEASGGLYDAAEGYR